MLENGDGIYLFSFRPQGRIENIETSMKNELASKINSQFCTMENGEIDIV